MNLVHLPDDLNAILIQRMDSTLYWLEQFHISLVQGKYEHQKSIVIETFLSCIAARGFDTIVNFLLERIHPDKNILPSARTTIDERVTHAFVEYCFNNHIDIELVLSQEIQVPTLYYSYPTAMIGMIVGRHYHLKYQKQIKG